MSLTGPASAMASNLNADPRYSWDMKPRTLLRYHGGKWRLAPWIISHFPEHRVYVEPFGWWAGILLRKARSYAEIYNDLDSEIVNLFRIVRNQGEELARRLYLTPFSREEYGTIEQHESDPIERARRTVIRSFMGFSSTSIHRNTGFRADSNRSGTTPAHDWSSYPESLAHIIERLRGVVIENRDAIEVMRQHDSPTTLHYVDPPYHPETRTKSSTYRFDMITDSDHIRLVEFLKTLSGTVIVSGYSHWIYNEWLRGWHCFRRDSIAEKSRKREEFIWVNRQDSQGKIEFCI